jgi:hydroxyacid-oxoacid transhydrogenase
MHETVFTYAAPPLKFGAGSADEAGFELARMGARRVLIVTDVGVAATGAPQRLAESVAAQQISCEIYDQVQIEPTDVSLRHAIAAAGAEWDALLAVGGGSTIDTAKAINLMGTNTGDLLDYVNAPVGGGRAPAKALRPLVAVPTTTGTGSESTPVCVLDIVDLKLKTGISHPSLRPSLAIIDPLLTLTQPPMVTAACAMDILCHALESFTARPFSDFPAKTPAQRVPYCGANPIADMFAERAMRLLSTSLRPSIADGQNLAARTDMAMAATFAGMGFGNAGVHLPHAMAYPVAGGVRDFRVPGYPDAPLIPHGIAVCLTAPAALRFTFPADPGRHLRAAELLGSSEAEGDPRERLPLTLSALMREIGIPNGLTAVGFGPSDIDTLVAGTMQQQRLLGIAPLTVREEDVAQMLRQSMTLW